ncbi:hypothetical protein [Absidia glauca]|uniref:Reverse transcriptase zinc-binding domain-containing protein n=1 Tax=Absidia glauca TaxID=4829 RepID=A0A168MI35_ABSGL|nr:hypothetical protein [Absidia glauca]
MSPPPMPDCLAEDEDTVLVIISCPEKKESGKLVRQCLEHPRSHLHKIDLDLSDTYTQWHPVIEQLIDTRFQPTGNGRPLIHKMLLHWTIPTEMTTTPPIPIFTASPKTLRMYWQKNVRFRPEVKPPYAAPRYINMSPDQWSVFWTLTIPHGVRNFWWRLLVHKLPTRSRLVKFNMPQVPTPTCAICQELPEDDHHMVIACPVKEQLWLQALSQAGSPLSTAEIWNTITFVTVPRTKKKINAETTTLTLVARILLVIWQQHWASVLDDSPWNADKA